MARKSNLRIAGESALANLNCIHDIAAESEPGATYTRNAGDCARWCKALQAAGMPFPDWMVAGNLRYFAAMWGFKA
jgi:hypothetical protein